MRSQNQISLVFAVLAATLAGCSSVRDAMEGHQSIVAIAAGYPLTTEKAAEFLDLSVPRSVVPNASLVGPTVDTWISYVLLATELASPDEFADVDLEPLIEGAVARTTIRQLQDEVILARIDTSDVALRTAYEREQPFISVETYQIMISTSGANEAELDSLRRFTEAVRERAAAGEDFGRLAREYSQDPTSARQDGYIGWVSRGRLFASLDSIVLAMEPGEVSETVRSPVGYHVFKVTNKILPDFESVRDAYRNMYMQSHFEELERAYRDSLVEAADVRFARGATGLLSWLARSRRLDRLGTAASATVLARYRGGAFTVGDWERFVNRDGPATLQVFSVSDSATIHELLLDMVQEQLLLTAARDLGHTISEEEYSSQLDAAYRGLQTVARRSGLHRQDLVSGEETIPSAVERAVRTAIEYGGELATLYSVSLPLRQKQTVQVYPERYPAVSDLVIATRQGLPSGGGSNAAQAKPSREQS